MAEQSANNAPTTESVIEAFDIAGSSELKASHYSGFMYTGVLGLFLLMSVFIVVGSLRDGNSVEERQFNFINAVALFSITFVLILLFIGVVIVTK